MKCEQVQELFPELTVTKGKYPEAIKHMGTCAECKMLFKIFESVADDKIVHLAPEKREKNFIAIQKKMKRHDRVVFTRRISSVAAIFLLAIVSIFNINGSGQITLADISDDVLYLQSESTIVPEVNMDNEAIIAYLAEYESIETLGTLF
jgi:hypothetical protein